MAGQRRKKKRKLRIVLHIGPLGLQSELLPAKVQFVDRPQNLAAVTRGEGQALQFVLEDWDCNQAWADGLQNLADGDLLQHLCSQQRVLAPAPEPSPERGRAIVRALSAALKQAEQEGRLTAETDESGVIKIECD